MNKLVSDLSTGIVSEVPLTDEEMQEIAIQQQAEMSIPATPVPTKEQLLAQLDAIQAQINSLTS